MNDVSYLVCAMKKGLSQTCYRFFSTLANPTRLAAMERLSEVVLPFIPFGAIRSWVVGCLLSEDY